MLNRLGECACVCLCRCDKSICKHTEIDLEYILIIYLVANKENSIAGVAIPNINSNLQYASKKKCRHLWTNTMKKILRLILWLRAFILIFTQAIFASSIQHYFNRPRFQYEFASQRQSRKSATLNSHNKQFTEKESIIILQPSIHSHTHTQNIASSRHE